MKITATSKNIFVVVEWDGKPVPGSTVGFYGHHGFKGMGCTPGAPAITGYLEGRGTPKVFKLDGTKGCVFSTPNLPGVTLRPPHTAVFGQLLVGSIYKQ